MNRATSAFLRCIFNSSSGIPIAPYPANMAYSFRPGKILTDEVAALARALSENGQGPSVSIAALYDFGARRVIDDYRRDPEGFAVRLRVYLEEHKKK